MSSPTFRSGLARALRTVVATAVLLGGTAVQAKGGASDAELPGEVLVQLRSTQALRPLLLKYRLSLVSQFGARPIYRLKVVGTADVHAKITALLTNPDVLLAEPNVQNRSPEARKNNAWAIGTPTAYATQWAPAAMHLPEAQRLSTGVGVRVAVLDTGVDRTHPALAGRLLPGFDFVDFDNDPSEVGSRLNIAYGHGTHVAGLIAMVAPRAKIMPLRVLDAEGQGNAWVLAEALLYAVDPDRNPATNDGAQVINLSLGSLTKTSLLDTVAKLAACALPLVVVEPADDISDPGYNDDKDRCGAFGGAFVVAAAGNDASTSVREYPAAEGVYGLMAVAASHPSRQLTLFSNSGGWIHVAAPGARITSAVPGGGYGTWSGTSMAAPLASGTAALLRSLRPRLTPREVTRRLVGTGTNLCGTRLRQVDALAALKAVVPADLPCP